METHNWLLNSKNGQQPVCWKESKSSCQKERASLQTTGNACCITWHLTFSAQMQRSETEMTGPWERNTLLCLVN